MADLTGAFANSPPVGDAGNSILQNVQGGKALGALSALADMDPNNPASQQSTINRLIQAGALNQASTLGDIVQQRAQRNLNWNILRNGQGALSGASTALPGDPGAGGDQAGPQSQQEAPTSPDQLTQGIQIHDSMTSDAQALAKIPPGPQRTAAAQAVASKYVQAHDLDPAAAQQIVSSVNDPGALDSFIQTNSAASAHYKSLLSGQSSQVGQPAQADQDAQSVGTGGTIGENRAVTTPDNMMKLGVLGESDFGGLNSTNQVNEANRATDPYQKAAEDRVGYFNGKPQEVTVNSGPNAGRTDLLTGDALSGAVGSGNYGQITPEEKAKQAAIGGAAADTATISYYDPVKKQTITQTVNKAQLAGMLGGGAVGSTGSAGAAAPTGTPTGTPTGAASPAADQGTEPAAQSGGGVDYDAYANDTIKAESGGVATAKNPLSTATGLGQFTQKTWLNTMQAHRPDLTQGKTPAQILAMRNDPTLSREMTIDLAKDNGQTLTSLGQTVTPTSLGMAHLVGPQHAAGVLEADPSTPLNQLLSPKQIAANPKWAKLNAGQFTANVAKRYPESSGSTSPVQAQAQTGQAQDTSAVVSTGSLGIPSINQGGNVDVAGATGRGAGAAAAAAQPGLNDAAASAASTAQYIKWANNLKDHAYNGDPNDALSMANIQSRKSEALTLRDLSDSSLNNPAPQILSQINTFLQKVGIGQQVTAPDQAVHLLTQKFGPANGINASNSAALIKYYAAKEAANADYQFNQQKFVLGDTGPIETAQSRFNAQYPHGIYSDPSIWKGVTGTNNKPYVYKLKSGRVVVNGVPQ